MPLVMTTLQIPERLALLIAEFDRSGVGELQLKGPDFQLHLRAGRKPDYRELGTAATSAEDRQ